MTEGSIPAPLGSCPNERGERLIWLEVLLGASVDQVDCLVRADIDMEHIRRYRLAFPAQIQGTILALRYFSPRPMAGYQGASTFFQLAEPLSTTCSSTRSASRQFVTFTVTVPPASVFGCRTG